MLAVWNVGELDALKIKLKYLTLTEENLQNSYGATVKFMIHHKSDKSATCRSTTHTIFCKRMLWFFLNIHETLSVLPRIISLVGDAY